MILDRTTARGLEIAAMFRAFDGYDDYQAQLEFAFYRRRAGNSVLVMDWKHRQRAVLRSTRAATLGGSSSGYARYLAAKSAKRYAQTVARITTAHRL